MKSLSGRIAVALSGETWVAMLWIAMLWVAPLLGSCEPEERLKDAEVIEIGRVFETGSSFTEDAYIRAETMRVLELLADPRQDDYALARLEDPSAMVRVAALRVLLATEHPEASRSALSLYTRSKLPVRRAVLSAAQRYGPEALRLELYDQAMRSEDAVLREMAFRQGALRRFDLARERGDEEALKVELIPMFSKLVESDEVEVAAGALERLIAVGRSDRAEPLRATLADKEAPIERRLRAARVLRRAGDEPSLEAFAQIGAELLEGEEREQGAEDNEPKRRRKRGFTLPMEKTDKRLLRAAALGAAALGDDRFMRLAQDYLKDADEAQTLEVLHALDSNPSAQATLSLKVALQDARAQVRYFAIERYSARPDADFKALAGALRQDDQRARRMIADVLVDRFPERWGEEIALQLGAPETRLGALRLLRSVLDSDRDAAVLEALIGPLSELIDEEPEEVAEISAYLLLLARPDDADVLASLGEAEGTATRYALLTHLMTHQPQRHAALFRRYLYDDLFALRLMSAAGLFNAFKDIEAFRASGELERGEPGE